MGAQLRAAEMNAVVAALAAAALLLFLALYAGLLYPRVIPRNDRALYAGGAAAAGGVLALACYR